MCTLLCLLLFEELLIATDCLECFAPSLWLPLKHFNFHRVPAPATLLSVSLEPCNLSYLTWLRTQLTRFSFPHWIGKRKESQLRNGLRLRPPRPLPFALLSWRLTSLGCHRHHRRRHLRCSRHRQLSRHLIDITSSFIISDITYAVLQGSENQ